MLGKQVGFYMRPSDEQAFLSFVLSNPAVVLLTSWSYEPQFRPVLLPLGSAETEDHLWEVFIWNTEFGMSESYFRKIHLKEYSIEQARLVETGEVRYYVDTDNAPVVEFIRSFVNQYDQLTRGRIYANMFQLAGKELVKKDDKFEAWYDQIARWLRRHMKREPGLGAYLGSEASSWYHGGGVLGR